MFIKYLRNILRKLCLCFVSTKSKKQNAVKIQAEMQRKKLFINLVTTGTSNVKWQRIYYYSVTIIRKIYEENLIYKIYKIILDLKRKTVQCY